MSEAAHPLRPQFYRGCPQDQQARRSPFILTMETVQDTEEQDLLLPVAACWLAVHILAPTHKTKA